MFQMIVEIRQRLGAMNIYIPDSDPSTQVTLSPEGQDICWSGNTSNKKIQLRWPSDALGKLSGDSLHNLVHSDANGSAYFRVRLVQNTTTSALSLISFKDALRSNEKKIQFRMPCGLTENFKGLFTLYSYLFILVCV